VRFGDALRIFGYPSTGSQTVTSLSGTVNGFETGIVGGSERRVAITTDSVIDSGTSGGAAVDLQGRLVAVSTNVGSSTQTGGLALGGGGRLVPINLISDLGRGAPEVTEGERGSPLQQDQFEPNNTLQEAAGPLTTGQSVQAYIGTTQDVDVFYFDTATNSPISASLTNVPSGTDYDLYIYSGGSVVAQSETQGNVDESTEFRPGAPGRFQVAVSGFNSSNASEPYTLTVNFDGGRTSVGAISVRGSVLNGNTGRAFDRGVIGLLNPGVTCDDFFGASSLDMSLVASNVSTGGDGSFTLTGVVTGESYATFFFSGSNHQCQNGWLNVPDGSGDIQLDPITLAF
jgi:hypothetical protein